MNDVLDHECLTDLISFEQYQNLSAKQKATLNIPFTQKFLRQHPLNARPNKHRLMLFLFSFCEESTYEEFSGIQKAIDKGILTESEALSLPCGQISCFGNRIVQGLILEGTHTWDLLANPELFKIIHFSILISLKKKFLLSLLFSLMITNTSDKFNLSLCIQYFMTSLIIQILIEELIPALFGQLTKKQIKNYLNYFDVFPIQSIRALNQLICQQPDLERTILKNPNQWLVIEKFDFLVTGRFLTIEQLIGLSKTEQYNLSLWIKLAESSELDEEHFLLNNQRFQYSRGNPPHKAEIANRLTNLIQSGAYTLDEMLSISSPIHQLEIDNRINSLIIHGKLKLDDVIHFSMETLRKFCIYGVYDLVYYDILTVEQIIELTLNQCHQLENPLVRDEVLNGALQVADIPNFSEEHYEFPRRLFTFINQERFYSPNCTSLQTHLRF